MRDTSNLVHPRAVRWHNIVLKCSFESGLSTAPIFPASLLNVRYHTRIRQAMFEHAAGTVTLMIEHLLHATRGTKFGKVHELGHDRKEE